jgi:MazG family protein
MDTTKAGAAFARLAEVMRRLRSEGGCPWDLVQTHATMRPYLVEETYEVIDALDQVIEKGDSAAGELRAELGDLLFQVVFHARLAEERGAFDLEGVCRGMEEKLVRRHPHVFGGESAATPGEVSKNWEQRKLAEQASKNTGEAPSALGSVPRALPALLRAQRVSEKASKHGFDWPSVEGPKDKITEELREIETAEDATQRAKEVGDLLFAVVNYARHLGVNAEDALRGATDRFQSRFRHIEVALHQQGRGLGSSSLAEMDALWDEAKRKERGA